MTADDYLHRSRLTYRQNRHDLSFDVGEGLFSGAGIDAGTRFLLRWLGGSGFDGAASVVDVGCGYGPIGIALARFGTGRRVLGLDRDALAVEYTARNALLNGVDDRVEARSSLGFDAVAPDERFELVASNIPAKVGPRALEHFLFGGARHLAPGGRVAVVVIDRLRASVEGALASRAIDVIERHDNRAYAVFVYGLRPSDDRDTDAPYARGEPVTFWFGEREWTVRPTFTVPEFDTLSYSTREALSLLDRLPPPSGLTVVGVTHGHLGAWAAVARPGVPIALVDRDLLALQVARQAVGETGVTIHHTARPGEVRRRAGDAVVVRLDEKEPVRVTTAAVAAVLDRTDGRGTTLLHGRTADVSRVLALLGGASSARFTVGDETRSRGHAAVRLDVG